MQLPEVRTAGQTVGELGWVPGRALVMSAADVDVANARDGWD